MRHEDLTHILRMASRVVPGEEMLVIGSQAIHGSVPEHMLPEPATFSREVDIAFWSDPENLHSDRVDADLGELSPFDEMFGYYAQGVSVGTATLPAGWRDRVVRFADEPDHDIPAWFLERHDLALSKLAAQRQKDKAFVFALLDAGILDVDVLLNRLDTLPVHPVVRRNIASLLRRWRAG